MDDDRSYSAPIIIKATTIQHRYDEIAMDWMVDGRFEIQWAPNEPWVNIGIKSYSELEWKLMTSIMTLGARRTNGIVDVIIVDTLPPSVADLPRGCDDWPKESPGA
jgi:hypothetical protein